MGRSISGEFSQSNVFNVPTTTGTKVVGAGYMGEFGTGLWQIFGVPGTHTFTVPLNVSSIRVRVVGAGGSGASGGAQQGTGGGGGGYAHGVFNVTSGTSYTITVGSGGVAKTVVELNGNAGGSSSFGSLISATGGGAGLYQASSTALLSGGAGGIGTGGDFQASGGNGGSKLSGFTGGQLYTGGGGAGSQLGAGGSGGDIKANISTISTGGGGVVNNGGTVATTIANIGTGGGSAFSSPDINPTISSGGVDIIGTSANNPISASIRFPFDSFTGAGGNGATGGTATNGTLGGGGGGVGGSPTYVGKGGIGGGGGGGGNTTIYAGNGGIGGGGGAGYTYSGSGGNGLVVVEW